jgi:predicted nucleic acid-binding protein
MIVIADTGPIISLAVLDKLELLDSLGEALIPPAVWNELMRHSGDLDIPAVQSLRGKVRELQGENKYSQVVDLGESEAITLYQEMGGDYLLIDDKDAKQFAESQGIHCVGSLAILINAKKRGMIDSLRPLFLTLLAKNRYYSITLLNTILLENGETGLR